MNRTPAEDGAWAGNNEGSVDDNPHSEGSAAHKEWEDAFQKASYGNEPLGGTSGYEKALDKTQAIRDQVRQNLQDGKFVTQELRDLAQSQVDLLTDALNEAGRI